MRRDPSSQEKADLVPTRAPALYMRCSGNLGRDRAIVVRGERDGTLRVALERWREAAREMGVDGDVPGREGR